MSAELALIAISSVAGAISAAFLERLSLMRAGEKKKTPHFKSSNAAKVELVSLLFEKNLASEAITRVYEASQQGKIDRLERDRLLLRYKQQLDTLSQRISHLQPMADYTDLLELRNSLVTLLKDRISTLDQRLVEMSKFGLQPEIDPKVQEIITDIAKVQTASIEHKSFKEEEKSIDQLQSEIAQALQRLEEVELDRE